MGIRNADELHEVFGVDRPTTIQCYNLENRMLVQSFLKELGYDIQEDLEDGMYEEFCNLIIADRDDPYYVYASMNPYESNISFEAFMSAFDTSDSDSVEVEDAEFLTVLSAT